jgi:putative two-component system hydrogenase maturation factor HypX/HoxX
MRILLISTMFNGFTQRVFTDLVSMTHEVTVELAANPSVMREAVALFKPDIIICPFLKQAVPEDIWKTHLTIIMHPGIKGDRGPSSIDWAIMENRAEWGMTALEADADMDAGDVWATHNFELPLAPKSYIYRTHITEAGMTSVCALLDKLHAIRGLAEKVDQVSAIRGLSNFSSSAMASIAIARAHFPAKTSNFLPECLNTEDPKIEGRLRPLMKQVDRRISWESDSTEMVLRKIHAADGFPGVLDKIGDLEYLMFGAHFEDDLGRESRAAPGEIIATRHGAICRKTVDGAVWLSHLKRKAERSNFFKLPATNVLPANVLAGVLESPIPVLFTGNQHTFKEIWYKEQNGVGYLYWEFYNGAMSTEQCRRLEAAICEARQRPTKVLVFMGGKSFWSNGIHLNMIENASDPAIESWNNINAIDDVVLAMLTTQDRLTVSAIGANAGAGGIMLALASDHVFVRSGVVLNPHYKAMGLHGSEYWTYNLPKRVGPDKALELTNACLPINAANAVEVGMIDTLISCNADAFEARIIAAAEALARNVEYSQLLADKQTRRARDEAEKPLSLYRHEELSEMRTNFWDKDGAYHLARRNFVHKISCGGTPLRLAKHRQPSSAVPLDSSQMRVG